MKTIAQQLLTALNNKNDIKTALANKGVSVTDNMSTYASLIDSLSLNFTQSTISIPSESITTHKSDGTTAAVTYSKYVGILDENLKEWDVKDWDAEYVKLSYDNTKMPIPIGFWINYNGLHYKIFLPNGGNLYDISGTIGMTNSTGNYRMKHSMYSYTCYTSATSGSNSCITSAVEHGTAGKYNSGNWSVTVSNGVVTLISSNTGRTFSYTNTSATKNGFDIYYDHRNSEAINTEEMLILNCEWLRDRHAICSGISTTEVNGTEIDVDILNSEGNQAAVNEDMYFYINGTNTGLLAKYNLCTNGTTGTSFAFTLTMANTIYAKLIASGINMNDTGVNSVSKPVLTPGAKGATAVAVNGYWYITTPFITNPNNTLSNTVNVPDAPACYYMKFMRTKYNNIHNAQALLWHLYHKNRTKLFTPLTNMLKTNQKFSNITTWTNDTENCWLSFRSSAGNSWFVYSSGAFYVTNSCGLYVVVPVVAC